MASKKKGKGPIQKDPPPPRSLQLNLAPLAPDLVSLAALQAPVVNLGASFDLNSLTEAEYAKLQLAVGVLQQTVALVAVAAQPGGGGPPPPAAPPPPDKA